MFTPFRVVYVCPFVALLKATYVENSHIVLSCRYEKVFMFNLLCVFSCFLEQLTVFSVFDFLRVIRGKRAQVGIYNYGNMLPCQFFF